MLLVSKLSSISGNAVDCKIAVVFGALVMDIDLKLVSLIVVGAVAAEAAVAAALAALAAEVALARGPHVRGLGLLLEQARHRLQQRVERVGHGTTGSPARRS